MTKAPSIKEALEYIANARWNENADLDDICTMADRALATLSPPGGERREAIADWSDLPRDIYVIGAQRMGAVVFDVQCCSVPMVMAPEVRYVRADIIADEAAIRADEREKCAAQADAHVSKEFDDAWIVARAIRYRNAVEIAKSSGAKVHPRVAAIRAADVTTDDLVRVIKTVNVDFGGWEPDLARALRDAFDMRKR